MGKLFQKMYIGNPNKPDLTKEKVASQTRLQLFFTVIQVRGGKLILLNALYSLFLIPTLFLTYIMLVVNQDFSMQGLVPFIYMYFPCFLIAMPGTLGFTNVLHRWANDEHAWIGADFWDGIKKNWKQGLIVTIINYFVLLLLIYCTWFWGQLAVQNEGEVFQFLGYIRYIIMGLIIVYFLVHLYIFPMMVRYKLTIKEIYKYSFLLAFRCFLGSVACVLGLAIYLVLIYLLFVNIPDPIFLLLFFVFMVTLPYLAVYVYMGSAFDKYVYLELKE